MSGTRHLTDSGGCGGTEMDIEEFIKTLDGVIRAKYSECDDHVSIELYIEHGMEDIIDDVLDPHWEEQWREDAGMSTRIHYTDTGHYIDDACFLTPHTASRIPDDVSLSDLDASEEETSQGYFRKWSYIHCGCGEMFTGDGAMRNYQDHL